MKVIIDVREKDEFLAEHVDGSINVPLSDFPSHAPGVLRQLADRELIFLCRSGNRARLAVDSLAQIGVKLPQTPKVFTGGILAWKEEGRPTVRFRTTHLPILRQVHLVAGGLVLLGAALALTTNVAWAFLSLFVGAGLMVAGATGFCGMAKMLSYMPWNRQTDSQPSTANIAAKNVS